MQTTLYLVRHGETEWNRAGRWQGQSDVALSPLGWAQAHAVGQRLAAEPLAAVYTSDLLRARDTAQAIAEVLDRPVPVRADRRLREVDVGHVSGLTRAEVAEAFPDFWAAMRADPFRTPFPGGESYQDLQERAVAAVREIAASHPGEVVAVVTHGGVVRSLVAWLLGLDPAYRSRILVHNCGLTVIEWGEPPRLRTLNETAHLAALRAPL